MQGYGYEVTTVDVRAAYSHTMTAAANARVSDTIRTRIRALFDTPAALRFVASVIVTKVGLQPRAVVRDVSPMYGDFVAPCARASCGRPGVLTTEGCANQALPDVGKSAG